MSHLAYNKAIRPISFFAIIPSAEIIYREAILAYLFGLPDASIPTSLRCLEVGLTYKYTIETGQAPPERGKLFHLIEWAEQYLGNRKEIAHGFRLLRNLIHEPSIMAEQDALEAIRHVTNILNLLYPLTSYAKLTYSCQVCRTQSQQDWSIQQCYLGNVLNTYCAQCKQPTSILVL